MSEDIVLVTVKVDRELRDAFVATCRDQDSTSAQELRKFMRNYVKKHGQQQLL